MMGAAGALAAPGALGYGLLAADEGAAPSPTSPYARRETLAAWPTSREAAAPILVLTSEQADNPFGGYLAEILRAEGLNCFQVADLAQVARAPLDWYDTILLAECSPTAAGAAALERYAVSGGNLIAMRPAASLLPMLGLRGVGPHCRMLISAWTPGTGRPRGSYPSHCSTTGWPTGTNWRAPRPWRGCVAARTPGPATPPSR